MFDTLSEKLGSFRSDVEETAEDEADADEAVDAEAPESESHTTGESAETADAESADAGDEPAPYTKAAAAAAESSRSEAEPTSETTTDSESSPSSAEGATEDDDEPEAAEDEEGARGIGERAKLFATGKTVIDEDDVEGPLEDLELALLSSDVEYSVASDILDSVREDLIDTTRTRTTSTSGLVEDALADALHDVISVGQFAFDERVAAAEKPLVIIFTGVNGVGKTTSIAKLARRFESQGYEPVIANGDTYRAGANEQIKSHADALDVPIITHEQDGDPAAVIYDAVEYAQAHENDIVLGDTAGRLHTSEDLMAQLEKIERVVDPDMTLFVDEAVAGQDAVNRAREFDGAATVDGTILSKADADSNGGAAISVAKVTGKPILFLGTGQGYDDLIRFDPDDVVDRLLGDTDD